MTKGDHMVRSGLFVAVLVLSAALAGCSTIEGAAFGMKKDAEAVYNYMNKEDGWIKQTDNWMQEHLW